MLTVQQLVSHNNTIIVDPVFKSVSEPAAFLGVIRVTRVLYAPQMYMVHNEHRVLCSQVFEPVHTKKNIQC